MRQRRWLELLKDYDLKISYHPGKANRVADALSRKSASPTVAMLIRQFEELELEVVDSIDAILATLVLQPSLIDRIKGGQEADAKLSGLKTRVINGEMEEFRVQDDGSVWFHDRLCVPQDSELKREVLEEAHRSRFSIHPGGTKMYRDLKERYWWSGMKREIAEFVA